MARIKAVTRHSKQTQTGIRSKTVLERARERESENARVLGCTTRGRRVGQDHESEIKTDRDLRKPTKDTVVGSDRERAI